METKHISSSRATHTVNAAPALFEKHTFPNSYLRLSFSSKLLPHHKCGLLLFGNVFDETKKMAKLEYFRSRIVQCF